MTTEQRREPGRVWHVYLVGDLGSVNGVVQIAGRLVEAQRRRGVDADLFVAARHAAAVAVPDGARPWVHAKPSTAAMVRHLQSRLRMGDRPDLVHFHEVFRPPHRVLATSLGRIGVPYVVTAHAGLAPENRQRGRAKKGIYGALVERRFLRRAGALCVNSEMERDHAHRYLGEPTTAGAPEIAVIANALDAGLLAATPWDAPSDVVRPQVVTLCRYDVRQKGLDTLAELARSLPEVDVVVHGEQCKNEPGRTDALRASAPPNFFLAPPVHGEAKLAALRHASLFIQPSRWEGLSAALQEALGLGVPVAVSAFVGRTAPVLEAGAGVVLDDDLPAAAAQVRRLLDDRARLVAMGIGARRLAQTAYAPSAVAEAHFQCYSRVRVHRGAEPVFTSSSSSP